MVPDEPETPPGSSESDATERRLTARERREQRYRDQERKALPTKLLRRGGIAALVILLIAGGAWGAVWVYNSTKDKCEFSRENLHEHASFAVFEDGYENGTKRLSFQSPKFDLEGPRSEGLLPMKFHMHQPNDFQFHMEFGCATMEDFFSFVGGRLRAGHLKLDPYLHGSKVLEDNDTMQLKFYLRQVDGNWVEKPDAHQIQLRDGQRLLITYGRANETKLQAQQAAVPVPPEAQVGA